MIKKINISKLFILFLIFHLIIWVLVPSLTNSNLPLDTIEALAWGSNLDWGYSKHPPLSAIAVEFFYHMFGSQDWAYYLLSQIFVVLSLFVVWKFAQEFFKNKTYSFLAVLLLESIYFYNYTTPEFNVYVCELPFFALSVLFCWKAVQNNRLSNWLLLGLFAGLGVLSHYLFSYLLVAISIFLFYMIIKKKIDFRCLISLVSFFLVLLPHLIWIVENDYVTITYGLHRAGTGEQNFLDHLFYPVIFFGKQIGILIPIFFMTWILILKFKAKINLQDKKLLFLLSVTIIPIFLFFLTSMIMGIKIRTMWMTPFYLFFGVLLIYIFQLQINLNKLNNFIRLFIALFIISPLIYSYVSITQTDKRTDYDGRNIARLVQSTWDKTNKNNIDFVWGNEWVGGNLSYHLKDRPKWMGIAIDTRCDGFISVIKNKKMCLGKDIVVGHK
ncbi:glycosyltransferase family 39 protein [Pelagibacteraceae bacterium]|nr:glycosyltransferase family 39 protein [Pelagibacteraceae bacterium]